MRGNNTIKRLTLWAIVALLVAGFSRFVRPARLLSARVTAVNPGDPPIANVALRYARGALPERLIVDVHDDTGAGGSATVDGDQVLLEVPLAGAPAGSYRVTTTASYRVFGTVQTDVQEFSAS